MKGDRGVLSVRYFTFWQKGRKEVNKLFRSVGAMLAVNAGAALMLGLLSVPAYGQAADGFIGGMARDSASGKPVPKVQIVAHNIAQGTDHSTVTDAEGMYEFTNLEPGRYDVAAAKTGFETASATIDVEGKRPRSGGPPVES